MIDKPLRNPDFVYRTVADECLLVPIARKATELESIYALNEVGGFIWSLLDGEHDISALVNEIMVAFDVGRSEAELDLRELLAELESMGAIVPATGSPGTGSPGTGSPGGEGPAGNP